ncbi:MAG TPA: sigma-70 family RNA polymerase sigma factor [Candidatus Limnocylindria bacterium]|nr:sigma-70 family RNA polymerase sigma factor [Candidatus Limnocylindria bacterium]
MQGTTARAPEGDLGRLLDQHRVELTGYCYRMLASPFEAEDAVQETFLRAWRAYETFEGRAAVRTWLHRIATNVCLDMLRSRKHRVRPMDLGPAREPIASNLNVPSEVTWLEPIPDTLVATDPEPEETAVAKESVRLAFVAALQHLPARQRAALILCEVMSWKAAEVAELLETSVASVNSSLQRARATLKTAGTSSFERAPVMDDAKRELLARYVEAFERYDVSLLTKVIREDAHQSMPPFDLWLSGRDDMFRWWFGPGIACNGSKLVPTHSANGSPAFGQYKPDPNGGYAPWSLQVVELTPSGIDEITFFLETEKLFPLFGLPLHLD